jgi:hypothetical protein
VSDGITHLCLNEDDGKVLELIVDATIPNMYEAGESITVNILVMEMLSPVYYLDATADIPEASDVIKKV